VLVKKLRKRWRVESRGRHRVANPKIVTVPSLRRQFGLVTKSVVSVRVKSFQTMETMYSPKAALSHSPRRGFLPETTCCGNPTFPFRLHEMLNDAEKKNFDHIVSWQGPQAFKVHDRTTFEKWVLPAYYSQTRYKSFQRQRKFGILESHIGSGLFTPSHFALLCATPLPMCHTIVSMYGFVRACTGPRKGMYSHELFCRGKPKMCHRMVRIKIKSQSPYSPLFAPTSSLAEHQNASPSIPSELMLTTECDPSLETMSVLTTSSNAKPTRVEHTSNLSLQTSNTGDQAMQKMLLFRSFRIQRRSSIGCGTSFPTTTPNDLTKSIMDMNLAMIAQGTTLLDYPEANRSRRSIVTLVDSFNFEPLDPSTASLENEFADELTSSSLSGHPIPNKSNNDLRCHDGIGYTRRALPVDHVDSIPTLIDSTKDDFPYPSISSNKPLHPFSYICGDIDQSELEPFSTDVENTNVSHLP